MDGSEPGETVAAAVVSGAPMDLEARTVRYKANICLALLYKLVLITPSGFINQPSPQHNQVLGMDYRGSWTGIP